LFLLRKRLLFDSYFRISCDAVSSDFKAIVLPGWYVDKGSGLFSSNLHETRGCGVF
jgi:hypothetical protein